jgi:hypothetical protein
MELTLEQHLKNIEIAVANAIGKHEETTAIRASYIYVRDLVLKPKEVKEEK